MGKTCLALVSKRNHPKKYQVCFYLKNSVSCNYKKLSGRA